MVNFKKVFFFQKVSRRKRQSRSSSQNSSGGTTPITSTPVASEKKERQPLRGTGGSLDRGASVPLDDRTEAPLSGGENCDNCCKEDGSAARNSDTTNCCSRLVINNMQTQSLREKSVLVNGTQPSCLGGENIKESKDGGQENDCHGVETKVVLRQNVSSTKNSEKRVSFTDTTEAETDNKIMHK